MELRILYFARLREALAVREERVEVAASVSTIADLRAWLSARGGVWAHEFAPERQLRVAMQQQVVDADTRLVAGAELAFFPPVTGG